MKFLMIGAHQDDNEFRCGGITQKLISQGHTVQFLSMCNGCGGHHILSPEETTKVRAKESAAVADFLGIKYDIWFDQPDCALVDDLATRRRLIKYIREFSPDVIISHRANDYHADHRAAGQLVLDASYILVVPHECPEVPAMKKMPVIMYYEDRFTQPEFRCDLIVNIDDVIDTKFRIADLNVSQVYEWLPYGAGENPPENPEERFEWLIGMDIHGTYTDEEILALPRGYGARFAKTASRFRKELIKRFGEKEGSKIRFAEAFQISEYGTPITKEVLEVFNAL